MEEGYLALRWNNHNTIFTNILNLLREQEAYVDVSLACAGQLYPAHKFVLSTCSEYFKEMFNKNPCTHPIVFMKDVSTKDMEALLDFIYKGEVHVPHSDLGSLLRTAEALQVKGLAVHDDFPRGAVQNAQSIHPANVTPVSPSQQPRICSPITAHGKRKRSPESTRKDVPSKSKPYPDLSFSNSNPPRSMPKSKRIKKENGNTANKSLKRNVYNNVENSEESVAVSYAALSSPVDSEPQSSNHSALRNVNGEVSDTDEEGIVAEEFGEGETEEEEKNQEEKEERCTISDVGDNALLPNSDSSTYNQMSLVNHNSAFKIKEEFPEHDIIQVDLSEDRTQFIIGPSEIDSSSRTSSQANCDKASESMHQKPFVCPLCKQAFTRKDNLANHIKTHTGDRPFMCQYCHKCFSRKDYVKNHERIHTGEKPHTCEICGRSFTRKEGLADHMHCHSDFKAFSCETCGKSFKQKCGLRFHKRTHGH